MKTIFFLCLSSVLLACQGPKSKIKADLIVHHGVIYTADAKFSTAESFAVKNGRILAVGKNDSILSAFEAPEMLDAKGQTIFPGFIDSHCHFYGYGLGLQEVDLVGTKSFDEVIQRLNAFVKTHPGCLTQDIDSSPKWIKGRGWDQNAWAIKEFPDRQKLDSMFPTTPVMLSRIDGHALLANEVALKLSGIIEWRKIDGGKIGTRSSTSKEKAGHVDSNSLSGILIDNAMGLLFRSIPAPSPEQEKDALLDAQKNCFAVGLTTVDDAGLSKNTVKLMEKMQASKTLKMRIYAMLTDSKENLDYYLPKGPYKTERLNVRSFKFYADGALGSRGACLLEPYTDKPEQQGFLLSKPDYFKRMADSMLVHGFQMNTHCIGDSAVRFILSIIGQHQKGNTDSTTAKRKTLRWRIEHFQVTTSDDLKRLANTEVIPSVQPTHATSDMYWAKDRLGADRIKYAYAYQDLLKAAGKLALGTDFPVEDISPLKTFYAAVARMDAKGFPAGGFQPENRLSREDAIRGMTIWGAYANFEENEKGSIEAGKFADFVLLSDDLMKCELSKALSVSVLATFVNGEKVFQK
jgi:predicted amidohydrolase YtcJ